MPRMILIEYVIIIIIFGLFFLSANVNNATKYVIIIRGIKMKWTRMKESKNAEDYGTKCV